MTTTTIVNNINGVIIMNHTINYLNSINQEYLGQIVMNKEVIQRDTYLIILNK